LIDLNTKAEAEASGCYKARLFVLCAAYTCYCCPWLAVVLLG